MPDPTTSNVLLAVPTRGSDVGVWDVPINGDFTAIDGMLGGATTITLSSATSVLLSVPATGTVAASAGPNQSQNAVLTVAGTLSGICALVLTLPRRYVFDNQCTVGTSFYVQIKPAAGTGNIICLPPGEKTMVWYDGTNCDYVGLGRVGSFLDLAVATTPVWISGCTKPPYLPCDGATYSTSVFPALGNMLGSTFGGNGINTFGVPDFRNRFALPIDPSGQGRVTSAGSSLDGSSLAAAGGSQFITNHTHTATVTDPSHSHPYFNDGATASIFKNNSGANAVSGGITAFVTVGSTGTATTGVTVAVNGANGTTASSGNIPPALVFGCRFIKT